MTRSTPTVLQPPQPCVSDTSDGARSKRAANTGVVSTNLSVNFNDMLDPRLATCSSTQATHIPSAFFQLPQPSDTAHIERCTNTHAYLALGGNVRESPAVEQHFPPRQHEANNGTFDRPQHYPVSRPYRQSHLGTSHGVNNAMYSASHKASIGQFPPSYFSSRPPADTGSTPPLPPFGFPLMGIHGSSDMRSDSVTSSTSKSAIADNKPSAPSRVDQPEDFTSLECIPTTMTMPVFSHETINHVQYGGLGDEFFDWLFSNERNQILHSPMLNGAAYELDQRDSKLGSPQDSYATTPQMQIEPLHGRPPIPSVLDSGLPESILSEARRQHLLKLVIGDFKDNRHAQVTQLRQKILQGDHEEDSHVLSLRMLQAYINSFWSHMHSQLPLMHKPTFCAETCPDLLLVAIMVLGASCLEKTHGYEVTEACAELSFFLAWHARHLIFQDPDFSAPAKLWVFQALLLLEMFEKLYSTRSLHERAHVHHATTLTLMRRGSSLVGRSAMDHCDDTDPTRTPPGPNGSINTSGKNTPDAWWNCWISGEATRRAAFAAFIIDATHACMFGHSLVMVAHEIRISLPCDEALWSAESGVEVKTLEQSLAHRGLKPVSFLEGLKKTLNGQPVRTNTFGRTTIMAGLLSVSWHMKMQDVRVSSIGVGRQGSWGSQLRNAFEHWKKDFDANLMTSNGTYLQDWYHANGFDSENVLGSRTVLHHLAHMIMHADVIDCQIYAGAKSLLGRAINDHEHTAAAKRMKERWAPSARARDACFYALRFLSEVLIPEDHVSGFFYSARDDNLLNRPWVMYIATLIIWAYGYALDGPMAPPTYTLSTHENKVHDMQGFLRRMSNVKSPEDLQNVKHRNSMLGLLFLLSEEFSKTRWELLHEASAMLRNCIELLMPGIIVS